MTAADNSPLSPGWDAQQLHNLEQSTGTGTIPVGDLPTASNSQAGVVQFDTTAPAATSTAGGSGSASTAPHRDHVHAQNFGGLFGDGSDGAVTFDGTTTVLGLVPSSQIYTLTRDIFCTSITINNGVTILPAGWRIFCMGTLTNNGTISSNGASASGTNNGTNGAAGTIGSIGSGRPGGNGATGAGASGTASVGVGTGSSGAGGNGQVPSSSANNGGAAVTAQTTGTSWFHYPPSILSGVLFNTNAVQRIDGGAGGASGGGDGTNKGGGGGAGGGVIVICAWAVVNNGSISVIGGAGGSPGTVAVNGGVGGGGGGSAGLILVFTLAAVTGSGSTALTGGALGTGKNNGSGTATNGTAGATGTYLNILVA